MSDSRVVISSDSEKSLSFAVRRVMFGSPKRETRHPQFNVRELLALEHLASPFGRRPR